MSISFVLVLGLFKQCKIDVTLFEHVGTANIAHNYTMVNLRSVGLFYEPESGYLMLRYNFVNEDCQLADLTANRVIIGQEL